MRDIDATRPSSFFFFFFPPTASCTVATVQPTAGAKPYQQTKEVPLLRTEAWQLTVVHRLDLSDNLLFAAPTSSCNLAPYASSLRRELRWGQISPNTLGTCQTDLCGQAVLQLLLSVFISEVMRSILGFESCGTVPPNGRQWYKATETFNLHSFSKSGKY